MGLSASRNLAGLLLFIFVTLASSGVMAQARCASIHYEAPSGSTHDILFAFDHAYPCGQFANGDWFVTPDTPDGAVTVTAITPDMANGRNGWDVNPDVRTKLYQSFDSRIDDYRAPGALPFAAKANSSIIKAVAADSCHFTCLQFAAVLTVLPSPPSDPGATFRPPPFGKQKPLLAAPMSLTDRLPREPVECCATRISPKAALAHSRNFRNNYSPSSTWGYSVVPADSVMDGRTWGGDIWLSDSEVMGFLMLDLPASAKWPVLVAFVQQGIDIWGANTFAGGAWYRGSGGNGAGALATYAFAAAVLNDPVMLADLKVIKPQDYLEASDFYRGRNGVALYGSVSPYDDEKSYWNGVRTGDASTRTLRDPHGYIDGGPVPGAGYEATIANQVSYTSIMLRAFPAFRKAWPNVNDSAAVMVDFGKRFHETKTRTLPDPCAPPNGKYGVDFGPSGRRSEGFLDCIPGSGRFPDLNGSDRTNRASQFLAQFYVYVDKLLMLEKKRNELQQP